MQLSDPGDPAVRGPHRRAGPRRRGTLPDQFVVGKFPEHFDVFLVSIDVGDPLALQRVADIAKKLEARTIHDGRTQQASDYGL